MTSRTWAIATAVAIVIIVAAAVVFYYVGPGHRSVQTASQSPIVGKAQVGQPAPEFEVSTTDGLFDLATAKKPVFLEVFATWCPHCQRETVVVDKLYEKYRSRVAFVAVSGSATGMDGTSASSQLDVLQWARRFNVRYPVAYDELLNVANLYLQGGFPTFALIGNDKKVAYLNSGEVSFGELDAAVAKLLR
ncbi:MAG: TlpA family protein disulfide reductase [Candidatus Eremiobacteraeota bacterium]|nr:TlpA family protein disulfide reductase [Candidatus Eremiobacteraeota bacterium]MBV8498032.1 TlpA family protein disulfide reductase [Candidatus Eremiobacteraeota bacterium]